MDRCRVIYRVVELEMIEKGYKKRFRVYNRFMKCNNRKVR